MEKINIFSLVIATLIPTIIGMIFYNKNVFGNVWANGLGIKEEDQKKANMPMIMIVSLIASFLIAFFMLNFCNGEGQEGQFDTFKHGVAHGVIISLFLVIPILLTKGLYELRPMKVIFINGLYWIITLALMGGVLDAMNHF